VSNTVNTWEGLLGPEKEKPYFIALLNYIKTRRNEGISVFPPAKDVFNAFTLTPAHHVKVVILGQDPYHGAGQAHGLCFSVLDDVKVPPSLRNIYKELCEDIDGFTMPKHGNLSHWAKQGVLLLNTVMTVEQGHAHSHKGQGWETFTDKVITQISEHMDNVVFLLWGAPAQKKAKLINHQKHHILTSVHPSPLSAHRGFLGCKHFSQTNTLLIELKKEPIDWQVD
jgi:uracil-DNA glycosylase